MGRGPRPADDPPMKEPVDLVAEIDVQDNLGSTGASASRATNACEREQEVLFDLAGPVATAVGEEVDLRAGDPIAVFNHGEMIGILTGSANRAMQSCIDFGYEMSGSLVSLDRRAGTGVLKVSGGPR